MTLQAGKIIRAGDATYTVGRRLAYRGKIGCRDLTCSQAGMPDRCHGWHCPTCHEPTSSQGHDCPLVALPEYEGDPWAVVTRHDETFEGFEHTAPELEEDESP
jgi:hypothetical protein